MQSVISTVVLNWNRSDLLEKTIDSYLDTVTVPYELFIIDNASTDESRDLIQQFHANYPHIKPIFLPENIGGDAINIGLEQSCGTLLHISENDIEYLPGWCERILAYFDAFAHLGQLSFFGPAPTDELVWKGRPACTLRHSRGRILYEVKDNVTTTCVITRAVWEAGIRVKTLEKGNFKFPDDGKLSMDIKGAGFMVAYADHYLVRNLGHCACEMENRRDYYLENCRSKPWVGESGFNLWLSEWKSRVKIGSRISFLLGSGATVSPEKSNPSEDCPEPYLWSMLDGWTAEVEALEFLFALVRLLKPKLVLETETWHGHAACAIAKGLRQNGRGTLVSLAADAESFSVAQGRISAQGLDSNVQLLNQSSLSYIPRDTVDFLVLNSDLEIREKEFNHFLPTIQPGAIVIFHDTSRVHKVVREGAERLIRQGLLRGLFLPTPRGIGLFRFSPPKSRWSISKVFAAFKAAVGKARSS